MMKLERIMNQHYRLSFFYRRLFRSLHHKIRSEIRSIKSGSFTTEDWEKIERLFHAVDSHDHPFSAAYKAFCAERPMVNRLHTAFGIVTNMVNEGFLKGAVSLCP